MQMILVRHGQTDNNREKRINGHYDEDINETGIEEARMARVAIETIDYDVLIVSPLLRARHTAELINWKGLEMGIDARLIERDVGVMSNRPYFTEEDERLDFWRIEPKYRIEGAETMSDVMRRIGSFYEEIKERYRGKTVLVVSHGVVAVALHTYLHGVPEDGICLHGMLKNAEVRVITDPRDA